MQALNLILLVDDDEPTNYLHEMLIRENNLAKNVDIVNTGREAIDYLKTKQERSYPCPDLIFLDINMPIMNGWKFLEEYRKLPKEQRGNIVIFMLTTSLNPEDSKKTAEIEEVQGFISKPLTLELYRDMYEGIIKPKINPI